MTDSDEAVVQPVHHIADRFQDDGRDVVGAAGALGEGVDVDLQQLLHGRMHVRRGGHLVLQGVLVHLHMGVEQDAWSL